MFYLRKKISMLAPLLAFVSIAIAQPDSARPDLANTGLIHADVLQGSNEHVLMESQIPGHMDTLWMHFGGLVEIRRELDIQSMQQPGVDRKSKADVLEMSLHDAITACEQGDINLLPLDQILPAEFNLDDYAWNGLQPCGIGHSVWADIITFDNTSYIDKPAPESVRDFFDIEAFPGKRVLKKNPRVLAEWSQLLAGVSHQDIYQLLSSENAWDILDAALQLLGPEVIWAESDRQALELLDSGKAVFALVSSQELVRRITEREVSELPYDHYRVIWDAAVAHMSVLTVPKQQVQNRSQVKVVSPEKALEFLRHVAEPFRNLQLSAAFGYAPVNMSRSDFIQDKYRHALPVKMHLDSVVWSNDRWWRESGAEIEKKFQSYIENTGQFNTARRKASIFASWF